MFQSVAVGFIKQAEYKRANLLMVTTRFDLDCRDSFSDIPAPLKLVLTKKGVRALIRM